MMEKVYRTAGVYVRNQFAGTLCETEGGYSFKYDAAYLQSKDCHAVSLTLPLQEEAYRSKTLFAFFDGLIPEGWLLDAVVHNWKMDRSDRFGILLVACHDSIGAVSIKGDGA